MKNNKLSLFAIWATTLFFTFITTSCGSGSETTETTDQESTQEVAEAEIINENRFGGLALYTLREELGQDLIGTLQAVVDAGYVNIEAAGYSEGKYYGMEPSSFKNLLDSLGLNPMSSHQSSVTLENVEQQVADAKAAGFKYLVVPVPPMGLFKFNREAQTLYMEGDAENLTNIVAELGEKAKAGGLNLLYHNHDFEFKEDDKGNVVLDYMLENTDPEVVNFQFDLYWVTKAGKDPLDYFEKYPGRFISWHVKDMDDEGRFAPVGTGNIDFNRILAKKDQSGMEFYYVEQDRTFNETPLEAIVISHEGLEKIGFE